MASIRINKVFIREITIIETFPAIVRSYNFRPSKGFSWIPPFPLPPCLHP